MAFNRITIIGIIALSLFILGLLIIFPGRYDQYVFYVGGEKLLHEGAIPFRDLMDTKPGLIFYIYGISTWLFGHSLYSARWLDLFFHIIVLLYFCVLIRRELGRSDVALLSVFVYAIFYVGGGPFSTGQAESFALLPNLILLDCTCQVLTGRASRNASVWYGLMAALAAIALILLKYTLGLFIITPIILALLFRSKKKTVPIYLFSFFIAFIAGLGLWVGFLVLNGALPNLIENFRWLTEYSSTNSLNNISTFKDEFSVTFVRHFTRTFGLSFIVLTIAGVYSLMRPRNNERSTSVFALYLLVQLILGIFTILLERKFLYYQFTRAFWCSVPFIAYGLLNIISNGSKSATKNMWRSIAIAITCLVIAFYSPLTDITGMLIQAVKTPMPLSLASARNAMNTDIIEREYEYAAEEIRPLLHDSDKVFIFGQHPGLYFHIHRYPPTFIGPNGFVTAAWAPAVWKQQMLDELKKANPKFILIEINDAVPLINASIEDSWEHFQQWHEFRDLVYERYEQIMPVNRYRIFRRISDR